jgi:hypothetical protein
MKKLLVAMMLIGMIGCEDMSGYNDEDTQCCVCYPVCSHVGSCDQIGLDNPGMDVREGWTCEDVCNDLCDDSDGCAYSENRTLEGSCSDV